ncbi:MFS transporter [Curvibacter sp. RS43]|uniref:MFS transporter n=1 Tax=Curvibacter microcysteis TaxID=3026419 RepID=UPI002360F71E|nr:MFS transporter [Curvibacter sp. RS43]MDD0811175.1 MFS transporter [Curvibacter sp. RS43]
MPAAPAPLPPAAPDTQRARFVAWLSLPQLISWGSVFYGFALLMEPLERELGMGRAESSLAFSLALLVEGLMAWPVGRWIDRGLERRVMAGGSLLLATGLLLHSQVHSVAGFYAVWALLGAGMACALYMPSFAVVTRRYPHDFRRAIITLTFLGGLASTVFIPLTDWLINALGWRWAVAWLGALQLLVCLPLHLHLLRDAPPPAAAKLATSNSDQPGVAQLLRSPTFWLVACFSVLLMSVTTAVPAHMVPLLRESGLSPAWVVALPASMGIVQVLGRLLLYFFEQHFDLHLANRLIPCLIPLGLAVLLLGHGMTAMALLFAALYGMGNGMLTIVKGTAIAQYVSREHAATLNGALGLPSALARAAAPLLLGLMWQADTGYRNGLLFLLGVAVLAVLALVQAQRLHLRAQTALGA